MENTTAEENWDYYTGKHRQFYSGQLPPTEHPMYKKVVAEIDRLFHPYNICAEVTDQFVNALVGKPFSWSLKDKNGESDDEAVRIIADWFEWQTEVAIDQDLGDPIANAITQMFVRDQGEGAGVGYLRLYSPPIYEGLEPYQKIVVHAPTPGTVEAERNRDGILYKCDYTFGDGEKETYELLPNGNTRISNDRDGDFVERDYGGRLPIIELKGRAIINEAIKRGQNSINSTLTTKDINTESAGFLERVITNGMLPGSWETDSDGNKIYKIDSSDLNIGAGEITWISGMPIGDLDSPSGYTNPGVHYRKPVPVDTFQDSIQIDVATIYFQVGLAYLLSSGDGKISGKSRLTLKEDFLIRLRVYERIIEAAIRKMLTIVMKQLEPDYPVLKGYKPVVELNLAVSPLPEERQQNREDVKTGVMSVTTAISYGGLDAQKEKIQIKDDLPLLKAVADVFKTSTVETQSESETQTSAEERIEDRIREQAKGNTSNS